MKTNLFSKQNLIVFVLCITTLMSTLDSSIVNIGMPTIVQALHTNFAHMQWVILSYMLALTALIVGIGRIGDIFGKKKLYIFGIALFTISSFCCGLSLTIIELIVFRILQGIGGAILITSSFAIVGDAVPAEKVSNSIAAVTTMLPVGFALGPSIGGFLINIWGWRSIFFINVPLGIISFILTFQFPSVAPLQTSKKFDIPGMLSLTLALACFMMSITLSETQGVSITVLLLIAGIILGIILFIVIENKVSVPLVPLKIFKNRIFTGSLIISIILYAVTNGYIFILPFYLEQARGVSTAIAGLILMAGPTGVALFTPLSVIAAKKFGTEKVMSFGILIICCNIIIMSQFDKQSSIVLLAFILFLCHGCFAFFQTPNNVYIMTLANSDQRGITSGLLNLARNMGMSVGTAVLGSIFYIFSKTKSITTASSSNIITGMHSTLLLSAVVTGFTFLISLYIYRRKKVV